jgi:hypothetical protein
MATRTESLVRVNARRDLFSSDMDGPPIEVRPEQPPAVVAALAEVVDGGAPAPDPWWQAGIEDALET